jgi:hypothetical protein
MDGKVLGANFVERADNAALFLIAHPSWPVLSRPRELAPSGAAHDVSHHATPLLEADQIRPAQR